MSHNKFPQPEEEPPIRWELVERIRREIAAGTYETPEKLAIALDRLLERLDQD
jgi:negative regulator of flagellin synthesis FlgM